MLKAARAQGMPMMVIAMMTAARTQPAAMYRPPKAIHNRLRKSAKADIGFFRGSRTMRPPGRHARDLETDSPVCQFVQPINYFDATQRCGRARAGRHHEEAAVRAVLTLAFRRSQPALADFRSARG